MRRRLPTILILMATLALFPFACIFPARTTTSPLPRVHLIQGMDNQPRFKSQQVNLLFADTREELINVLHDACEIELGLLVQYLYAALSLKKGLD